MRPWFWSLALTLLACTGDPSAKDDTDDLGTDTDPGDTDPADTDPLDDTGETGDTDLHETGSPTGGDDTAARARLPHTGQWSDFTVQELGWVGDSGISDWGVTGHTWPDGATQPACVEPLSGFSFATGQEVLDDVDALGFSSQNLTAGLAAADDTTDDFLVVYEACSSVRTNHGLRTGFINRRGDVHLFWDRSLGGPDVPSAHGYVLGHPAQPLRSVTGWAIVDTDP